jgi:hypothetical protein
MDRFGTQKKGFQMIIHLSGLCGTGGISLIGGQTTVEAVSQLYSETFPHLSGYLFPVVLFAEGNGFFECVKAIPAFRALSEVLFKLTAGIGTQLSVQIL